MLIGAEAILTLCINSDKVLKYKEFRGKNLALINSGMVCLFFFVKYMKRNTRFCNDRTNEQINTRRTNEFKVERTNNCDRLKYPNVVWAYEDVATVHFFF